MYCSFYCKLSKSINFFSQTHTHILIFSKLGFYRDLNSEILTNWKWMIPPETCLILKMDLIYSRKVAYLHFGGKKKKKNLNKKGKSNRKNKKKVGKRPGLPDGPEHPTSWLNTQTKGRRPKIIVQNSLSIHWKQISKRPSGPKSPRP